jgi:hypothetical protein
MTKVDNLTRLKHIRDAAMTAINFIKDQGRWQVVKDALPELLR